LRCPSSKRATIEDKRVKVSLPSLKKPIIEDEWVEPSNSSFKKGFIEDEMRKKAGLRTGTGLLYGTPLRVAEKEAYFWRALSCWAACAAYLELEESFL
jgi:hypothetical protein